MIKDTSSELNVLPNYAKISHQYSLNSIIKIFMLDFFFSWNPRSSSSKTLLFFPKKCFFQQASGNSQLFSQRLFALPFYIKLYEKLWLNQSAILVYFILNLFCPHFIYSTCFHIMKLLQITFWMLRLSRDSKTQKVLLALELQCIIVILAFYGIHFPSTLTWENMFSNMKPADYKSTIEKKKSQPNPH